MGGDDGDPTPWTEFPGIMTAVREVNDMKGNARDVQVRAKRVFAGILPALKIGGYRGRGPVAADAARVDG